MTPFSGLDPVNADAMPEWIDRSAGTVRIPIDRAKDLLIVLNHEEHEEQL